MIGEIILLGFLIVFMLICIVGVGLIILDKEREDK